MPFQVPCLLPKPEFTSFCYERQGVKFSCLAWSRSGPAIMSMNKVKSVPGKGGIWKRKGVSKVEGGERRRQQAKEDLQAHTTQLVLS